MDKKKAIEHFHRGLRYFAFEKYYEAEDQFLYAIYFDPKMDIIYHYLNKIYQKKQICYPIVHGNI